MPALGPVLIVSPDQDFTTLDTALRELRWQRDASHPFTESTIAGEPELAGWDLGHAIPRISYTFNPAVRLRSLRVDTLPPAARTEIARAIELSSPAEVASAVRSRDARRAAWGLLAAGQLDAVGLLDAVMEAQDHPDPTVSEIATTVMEALHRQLEARRGVISTLTALDPLVRPLLRELQEDPTGRAVLKLRPTLTEIAALFHDSISDAAAGVWDAAWSSRPPRVDPGHERTELRIQLCPAGLFRRADELCRSFPAGYRAIAGWMDPSVVWGTWSYTHPGANAGSRYEGLAWTGKRWIWCPTPHRILPSVLSPDLTNRQPH